MGARPRLRFILLSVPAAIVALELIGRLAGMPTLPPDPTFTIAREWSYPDWVDRDNELLWRYRPNSRIRDRFFAPGAYTINSHGFRTPEFTQKKLPGMTRVVCLGESTTFGIGIPDEGIWPRRLERSLRAHDSQNRQWEVLNLGVSNYSTHQGMLLARRLLADLLPDIVLLNFSWADHQPTGSGRTDAELPMPPQWRVELDNMLRRSALIRWGVVIWSRLIPSTPPAAPVGYSSLRVPATEFAANMEKICRMAIAAGARPIVVTSPIAWPPPGASDAEGIFHLHHRYRRLARFAAVAGGGEFVELANAFDPHPEFFDDKRVDIQNFNERGHAFAGDFLARFLLGETADTTDSSR